MSSDAPELHYQQPQPHRRRRLTRAALIVLLVLAAAVVSLKMLRHEIGRVRLRNLYDACTQITPPDVARSEIAGETSTSFLPRAWGDLNGGISSHIASSGTVFLGQLRTPDRARELLVGVDLVTRSKSPTILAMRARAIARGGPRGMPRLETASDQSVLLPDYAGRLVLHGGVTDPDNQSHFTIGFEADGLSGTIDGWLKDDGAVILEPRAEVSPTTASAPPSPGTSR